MKTLQCREIIKDLPPKLSKTDTCAIDLELSGLRDEQLHRPAGNFVSLAASFDGETAYIIFDETEIQEFLDNISEALWVFHNSTFDIGHLRRWANVEERPIRDTMLIEKILWADYYDSFGLNDLVRRYLKLYMPKFVRKEFKSLEGEMTKEQIEYAAGDVIGTWLVDQEQQKIMDSPARLVWEKIDMPTVWTSVGLSGFAFDKKRWQTLAEEYENKKNEIEKRLGKKYGTTVKRMRGRGKARAEVEEFVPFNPASPVQVLNLLNSQGLNIKSTGDEIISPFAPDNETVRDILDYRTYAKRVSTYGNGYLKFVEPDGCIYSSLNVIGSATGRMSSSSPNLQQVPRLEDYRSCFVAGTGKKLIIADYSTQEPRIFAYLSMDEALMEIFRSGEDLYCTVAKLAFGETITKKDKERRNQVKSLVLGLMYGLSPYGFAVQNEVELETAQEDFDRFFAAFPQAARWVEKQQTMRKENTVTVLGRKCYLHPYNAQWKRNALNNPIQGTAADMIKLAMREFRQNCGQFLENGRVGIILPVHDEIVLWANEDVAEEVARCLENTMVTVAEKIHKGIPAIVEAHIADTWAEK